MNTKKLSLELGWKKKKKVTVILPHVIPSSSSMCVCVCVCVCLLDECGPHRCHANVFFRDPEIVTDPVTATHPS